MANTAQARKRVRQAIKARSANAAKKSEFRTSIKNVLKSISDKNAEQSKKDFIKAVSCIDKLAAKGIIHKNDIFIFGGNFKTFDGIKLSLS